MTRIFRSLTQLTTPPAVTASRPPTYALPDAVPTTLSTSTTSHETSIIPGNMFANIDHQRTVAGAVSLSGLGIHQGRRTVMTIKPAPIDCGIVFRRVDIENHRGIPALLEHVDDTTRGTTLCSDGVEVHTVEHVMAALAGFGICNAIIELDSLEPPGADGSSMPLVEQLTNVGTTDQQAPRKVYKLSEPIHLSGNNGQEMVAFPSETFSITCTSVDDRNRFVQTLQIEKGDGVFQRELAAARTFCFYEEIEDLMKLGKLKGGSLDNAIVIHNDTILSKESLRFENEFVRHKILDIIADLSLIGVDLEAHIIARKPGHTMNNRLANAIYDQMCANGYNGSSNTAHRAREMESGNNNNNNNQKDDSSMDYLDTAAIMEIIPHRYPMLLVDRVTELTSTSAIGIKCVTFNEPFFQGHFPGKPVMPGVLIVEAMAQVGGILMLKQNNNAGKIPYFMSIKNAKFRKIVQPGDTLIISVNLLKVRARNGKIKGQVKVDGALVAEAELMFALVSR